MYNAAAQDGWNLHHTNPPRTGEIIQIFGTIVNGNNPIQEEIKGRILLGNKAFYAYEDRF